MNKVKDTQLTRIEFIHRYDGVRIEGQLVLGK